MAGAKPFSVDIGFPGVFTINERFVLERIATGTSLRHSMRCQGLAAILGKPFMKSKMQALMRSSAEAMAAYLIRCRSGARKGGTSKPATVATHRKTSRRT